MELLFFLVPTILHTWLMGEISFSETEEEIATKGFKEGIILFNIGKIDTAFNYFSAKIKYYPKSAFLHFYIGKCHFYFENYAAALQSFDTALRFDTTIIDIYAFKSKCHYFLEDWDIAFFQLKKASRFFKNENQELLFLLSDVEKRIFK